MLGESSKFRLEKVNLTGNALQEYSNSFLVWICNGTTIGGGKMKVRVSFGGVYGFMRTGT